MSKPASASASRHDYQRPLSAFWMPGVEMTAFTVQSVARSHHRFKTLRVSSRTPCHAAQHPTHARAGPRLGRFSPRPPRGRFLWRRFFQFVRRAVRKWERGRARGVMRSLGRGPGSARTQGCPRVGPGLGRAREALTAERFRRLKKTHKLRTLESPYRAGTKQMSSTQARELPCRARQTSPRVLHVPVGAGYSVPLAHRVSAAR